VIVDLNRFMEREKVHWTKLESILERFERDPLLSMKVEEIEEFHYLYQRASSDLVKVSGFSADADIRRYLESLVGRAYSQVHGVRDRKGRRTPFVRWFFHTFPVAFRRHFGTFVLSLLIVMVGAGIGAVATTMDKQAKAIIMPFGHLKGDPAQRVAREEKEGARADRLAGSRSTFSASLMTHNTAVSVSVFALGFTWGIGTVLMLFYNGVILGAVALDYVVAGKTAFLLGWLLPHGVIEIPAVLIAGQAGLLVASTLFGRGQGAPLTTRFRRMGPDLVTLLMGLAFMLVWAGIMESFFSQYHEPVLPYSVKIAVGLVELAALVTYLALAGRRAPLPTERGSSVHDGSGTRRESGMAGRGSPTNGNGRTRT
jgi:uncharacterized membrane protein SpoIIM required for sporulation